MKGCRSKKMHFYIMTLFPEMVMQGLNTSIIGRAMDKGILSIDAVNIRDYAFNKHNSVDDYPYGGGAGMLMQAEPVYQAYKAVEEMLISRRGNVCQEERIPDREEENPRETKKPRVIYLSPQGRTFNQGMAAELAKEQELIFLCGHYEGIDERVVEEIVTDYVSIGDYILTGGELPAMIMVDAISRLVPGVLHNDVSAEFESFQDNLLEYPQYSRPEIWHDKRVPEILLSGHHGNIEKWRREQSVLRTAKLRPDLLEKAELTENERKLLSRDGECGKI
jgi:tRNA (guanine37-N1)-methyltransferase